MSQLTVMTVFGTRPEAIKMAPVVHELRRRPDQIRSIVTTTGQHRQMLDQVLEWFQIEVDHDLDVMRENQTLAGVTCRILEGLDRILEENEVDVVLTQGDTTTAFIGALAGFYRRVAVGHIEAGLRTGNRYNPFPEEINRVLAGHLSSIHFAPTERARDNLLAENISADSIHITGNTVIDALLDTVKRKASESNGASAANLRRILVTAHRRESWGEPLVQICRAILTIVEEHEDVEVYFPVHLNPNVQQTVRPMLGDRPRITLTEPQGYDQFAHELANAHLILTDSGGVQEEAPSLGKPVLVLRNETERQEGVEAGTCRLVGQDCELIVAEVNKLLTDPAEYDRMATAQNPYGDGHASERIVDHLIERFGNKQDS